MPVNLPSVSEWPKSPRISFGQKVIAIVAVGSLAIAGLMQLSGKKDGAPDSKKDSDKAGQEKKGEEGIPLTDVDREELLFCNTHGMFFRKAELLRNRKHYTSALRACEHALNEKGIDRARVDELRAAILREQGNVPAAIKAYLDVADHIREPVQPHPWEALHDLYKESGNIQKAEAWEKIIADIHTENADPEKRRVIAKNVDALLKASFEETLAELTPDAAAVARRLYERRWIMRGSLDVRVTLPDDFEHETEEYITSHSRALFIAGSLPLYESTRLQSLIDLPSQPRVAVLRASEAVGKITPEEKAEMETLLDRYPNKPYIALLIGKEKVGTLTEKERRHLTWLRSHQSILLKNEKPTLLGASYADTVYPNGLLNTPIHAHAELIDAFQKMQNREVEKGLMTFAPASIVTMRDIPWPDHEVPAGSLPLRLVTATLYRTADGSRYLLVNKANMSADVAVGRETQQRVYGLSER